MDEGALAQQLRQVARSSQAVVSLEVAMGAAPPARSNQMDAAAETAVSAEPPVPARGDMETLLQYARRSAKGAPIVFKQYNAPRGVRPCEVSDQAVGTFQLRTESAKGSQLIIDESGQRCVCGWPWFREWLEALKAHSRFHKFEETEETFAFAQGPADLAVLLLTFEVSFWDQVGTISMCPLNRDGPSILSGSAWAACAAADRRIVMDALL